MPRRCAGSAKLAALFYGIAIIAVASAMLLLQVGCSPERKPVGAVIPLKGGGAVSFTTEGAEEKNPERIININQAFQEEIVKVIRAMTSLKTNEFYGNLYVCEAEQGAIVPRLKTESRFQKLSEQLSLAFAGCRITTGNSQINIESNSINSLLTKFKEKGLTPQQCFKLHLEGRAEFNCAPTELIKPVLNFERELAMSAAYRVGLELGFEEKAARNFGSYYTNEVATGLASRRLKAYRISEALVNDYLGNLNRSLSNRSNKIAETEIKQLCTVPEFSGFEQTGISEVGFAAINQLRIDLEKTCSRYLEARFDSTVSAYNLGFYFHNLLDTAESLKAKSYYLGLEP